MEPLTTPITTPADSFNLPNLPINTGSISQEKIVLLPYQEEAIQRFLQGTNKLLLFHGLGTGKTVTALTALEKLNQPYTVIAPTSVIPHLKDQLNKLKSSDIPVHILSFSEIVHGKKPKYPDILFIDEAHRLRNFGTVTAKKLFELIKNSKKLILSSATPIYNNPGDMAYIITALTDEDITPEEFEEIFIRKKPALISWLQGLFGVGGEQKTIIKNKNKLLELIKGKIHSYHHKIPVDIKTEIIEVPLSPEQMELYRAVLEKLPIWAKWKISNAYGLSEDDLKKLKTFLVGPRQISISIAPFLETASENPSKDAFDTSPKLQKAFTNLQNHLKDDPINKAIVYSNFITAGLNPYYYKLIDAGIPAAMLTGALSRQEREKIVNDYNDGKIRVLLLGPAGSEGISTKGTTLFQILDPHWNLTRLEQAIGRAVRLNSHIHLPPEKRKLKIEYYISVIPQRPIMTKLVQNLSGAGTQIVKSIEEKLFQAAQEKRKLFEELENILKSARSAVGIPDRDVLSDPSVLEPNKLYDLIIQKHKAQRAGTHYDIRIGDPEVNLLSWAARKPLPEKPKNKILAILQPLHEYSYKDFEGKIEEGYGKGEVNKEFEGKILITKVTPNSVHFTTAWNRFPERYVMAKGKGNNWYIINVTPTEPIPYEKVKYTLVPSEQAEEVLSQLQPGQTVQAKIDGAASLTKLLKDKIEILSYRIQKNTGRPIIHTERFNLKQQDLKIPSEWVGTILRGEIYAVDEKGVAIPPQELGGLLNASIEKSLQTQKEKGYKLKNLIFDVESVKDKPIDKEKVPYEERKDILKKVIQFLPKDVFHLPEEADTSQKALDLWKRIVSGKYPLTSEGVIIHSPYEKPKKVKIREDYDVYIRGFFKGQGKYEGKGVGGFYYSWTEDGPIVGKVGTGLSDELREDMYKNPEDYIGRVARVQAQGIFPKTKALRAPSFIALHEDK